MKNYVGGQALLHTEASHQSSGHGSDNVIKANPAQDLVASMRYGMVKIAGVWEWNRPGSRIALALTAP